MEVMLKPMTPEQVAEYLPALWAAYRSDMLRAGSSEAEADANIARNQAALTPEGSLAPGNFLYQVLNGDDAVGRIWLAQRSTDEWFVYDITIAENHRGLGLGRAAMLAAESHVRAQGGARLGLSVFGFNTAARHLYESLGYSILAMGMTKTLI